MWKWDLSPTDPLTSENPLRVKRRLYKKFWCTRW